MSSHHDQSPDQPKQRYRIARLIAVVAGAAGVLLCGVTPLLPVNKTTAAIVWPQGLDTQGHVTDVTAPLLTDAGMTACWRVGNWPCPVRTKY